MVDGGGGALFPVIFFNGESEANIGSIKIYPNSEFKNFQLLISQRIGVYPNQILIYMVRMGFSPEDRSRTLISGQDKFESILCQKGFYFYVILKRSKRSRERTWRPNEFDYKGDNHFNNELSTPAFLLDKPVPLLRNPADVSLSGFRDSGYQYPLYDPFSQAAAAAAFNNRLQNLMLQRENYEMGMAVPPINIRESDPDLGPGFISVNEEAGKNVEDRPKLFCEECVKAEMDEAAPFHLCVNDPVTKNFRSSAGPIARPRKPSV